ncbi:MAG: hypothetical protein H6732_02180 [Alphaproteobacteria bacterium]|nr:hypothetical protein [Alphaproteobacteria bacterium]
MIPTEYRLEQVSARLAERLDGARRSHPTASELEVVAAEVAKEHVEAAVDEWMALDLIPDRERHARFLEREVQRTFLPRFVREASAMTGQELSGFGLGWWGTPLGRMALAAAVVGAMWLTLRFSPGSVRFPLLLVELAVPALPLVPAWLARRRYRDALEELVDDMGRIQTQADAYVPAQRAPSADEAATPAEAARTRPPPQRDVQG